MFPGWIKPDDSEIRRNEQLEPQGERLRRELVDWLERNRIAGILLDTPHHHVNINFGPRLPNEIRNVLSNWGSIDVTVSDEIDWRQDEEAPHHPFEIKISIGGDDWEYVQRAMKNLLQHVEEREPQDVGCASGGAGGSHSIDCFIRDVSVKQFHEELEAWRRRLVDRRASCI